jgi:hypothetical protein
VLFSPKVFLEFCRKLISLITVACIVNSLQSIPSNPDKAQQLVGEACKLRREFVVMKADSLHRLQEVFNEVQLIDHKISEVDIHIGALHQVIDKSRHGMPSILTRKERTIVIEGCTYFDYD